ncbi:glycosyltransferase [Streptomyces sp. NPDC008125]|uniref:glycosyltransferase n=1 Tax=Streptomyces sp. NPDC008125 TaxID=3364811 RepID=UPI0036EBAD13
MNRTISVITAVYSGGENYLADAAQSVREQRDSLPLGWDVQWVVQEDGTTGSPLRDLPPEPWISRGQARRGGAAVARTMALPRATGELIRTLDADDLLAPGALARDIAALEAHPQVGWCISSGLDLLPDGTTVPGPYDPPEGQLNYEELLSAYDANLFSVLGTHLTVRKPLLHALGGWPALPAWETVSIVLRCAAVSPGWMIAAPGGLYRKHSEQTTARSSYTQTADFAELRSLVRAQAEFLRTTGWRWRPNPVEG